MRIHKIAKYTLGAIKLCYDICPICGEGSAVLKYYSEHHCIFLTFVRTYKN